MVRKWPEHIFWFIYKTPCENPGIYEASYRTWSMFPSHLHQHKYAFTPLIHHWQHSLPYSKLLKSHIYTTKISLTQKMICKFLRFMHADVWGNTTLNERLILVYVWDYSSINEMKILLYWWDYGSMNERLIHAYVRDYSSGNEKLILEHVRL